MTCFSWIKKKSPSDFPNSAVLSKSTRRFDTPISTNNEKNDGYYVFEATITTAAEQNDEESKETIYL